MTAAPFIQTPDPMNALTPAIVASIRQFSKIELADDDQGPKGWKKVSLIRSDAANKPHPVFAGPELDARICLARIAVRFPHLTTNLPKIRFPLREVSP